ncbi:MAG: hypothetical protein F4221_05310 [Rhodothermaceae bacterium]|nr:hypothetical protein [Rhodothermaceae bacterium]
MGRHSGMVGIIPIGIIPITTLVDIMADGIMVDGTVVDGTILLGPTGMAQQLTMVRADRVSVVAV